MYNLMRDHFPASGEFLFRRRSYLPFLSLPILAFALIDSGYNERLLGAHFDGVLYFFAFALLILGQLLRIITVGFVPVRTSGRNVAGQVADVLNTTGIYSIVRNPLYLANCMMYVGISLLSHNFLVALLFVAMLVPYYERIIAAEELFLQNKFGSSYEMWAKKTPAFFPRNLIIKNPELKFSFKTVIVREKASVLGAVTGVYLMKLGAIFIGGEKTSLDSAYNWALGLSVSFYILTKILAKSGFFAVNGRV